MDKVTRPENENNKSEHPTEKLDKIITLKQNGSTNKNILNEFQDNMKDPAPKTNKDKKTGPKLHKKQLTNK